MQQQSLESVDKILRYWIFVVWAFVTATAFVFFLIGWQLRSTVRKSLLFIMGDKRGKELPWSLWLASRQIVRSSIAASVITTERRKRKSTFSLQLEAVRLWRLLLAVTAMLKSREPLSISIRYPRYLVGHILSYYHIFSSFCLSFSITVPLSCCF